MSKFISVILGILLLFSMLSGCRNQTPCEDSATTQNDESQSIEESVTSFTNTENTPVGNALLSVLYNEVPFVDETGKSVYMKDYSLSDVGNPIYAAPESYAFLDFDGDENKELLVNISTNYGFFLVLRIDNEQVYGYKFTQRSMISPKTDGTFAGSSGAAENAIYNIKFSGNQYELTELAYKNDLPGNAQYRINGRSATQEDYQTFYNEYTKTPDIQWTNVDTASLKTD